MLWVFEFGPRARNKTECSVIGKEKLFIDYISLRSEKPLLEAGGTNTQHGAQKELGTMHTTFKSLPRAHSQRLDFLSGSYFLEI